MNVAKNWALTIMLIALAFAHFSSELLLKEQMIIPVKNNAGHSSHTPRVKVKARHNYSHRQTRKAYNRVQRISWLESHNDSHVAATYIYTWAWR